LTIPIVDLGSDDLPRLAGELGAACRGPGFFYVVGHGIPSAQRAATFAAAAEFFALPPAHKNAVAITRSPHNRGYVGFSTESLDPAKPADLKEAFNVGLNLPADDAEVAAGRPFRGVNLWPELPGFKDAMLGWYDACWQVGRRVHRALAVDLGLDPAYFEDKLDRPMATLRVLHYPPRPDSVPTGALGAGEHTDYGNLTLLATDAVPGLEVRTRDGQWLKAPIVEDAFVCNIGDCLMRWTNDIYVSTPHRVVSPGGQDRVSIAFFLDPNPDAIVECLPGCSGPDRPSRYPPIAAADYLRQRLDATYVHRRAGQVTA
jgi:isopenicillin N synthase-like dioxygenase